MNYPLYIARRISLSGDRPGGGGRHRGARRRGGTPAVKVAIAAVALSVAVMLAAIAIVSGFKREITAKVTGFNSHISLYAQPATEGDDNLISMTPSLRNLLDETPFVSDYSLQASVPAIFKTGSDFQGIYLKSLDGAGLKSFLQGNLVSGSLPDFSSKAGENQVLLSEITAKRLGLKTGDRIDTYFLTNSVRVRPLKVAGIFNSHFDSYDKVYAFGALPLIQKMGGIRPDQGTGISIHTDNFDNVDRNTEELSRIMAQALADGTVYKPMRVDNARSQGAGFFHWLALLDMNVTIVLVLMTFVAIVTLISGLLIIILDKKRFIGLLRALGAPAARVRHIFVYLSIKVAVTGMLIGNVSMLALLWAQSRWHFLRLDPESYYIDFVPVEIGWLPVLLLNVGVVLVVWLALILPSWFVAKISPAETLRYE